MTQVLSYSNKVKLCCITLLGFSSGLPFLLILSTLHIWMKECGCSNTTIGLLVFTTLPYSVKFLLAPVFNAINPPFFCKKKGYHKGEHYKGWIIWSQMGIIISLLLIGIMDAPDQIELMALLAFSIAFCSAIQDIYIEAYRIELVDKKDMSMASGLSNTGYRVGMWVSGAGALYLASKYNWPTTYITMAFIMVVGLITIWYCPPLENFSPENSQKFLIKSFKLNELSFHFINLFKSLKGTVNWRQVCLMIFGFKAIDTFLNVMAGPFMLDIGFSKIAIATVGKTFGIGTMIMGGIISGYMLRYFNLFTLFIMCTILQICAAIMCILQINYGADVSFLYISMGFEHFSSGAAATVFVTYLSLLSRHVQTAILYAVLTSLGSFARIIFSHLAGMTIDLSDWRSFFSIVIVLCCVFIITLLYLKIIKKHFEHRNLLPNK